MATPKVEMWTAPRRIYLDKNGAVIAQGDTSTDPVTLLVAAGAQIPLTQAITLGLASAAGVGTPSTPSTDLLILLEPGTTTTQTTTSATTSLRAGGGTGNVKVSWSGGSATLTPGAAATTVNIPSGTSVTFDAIALTSGPCAVYGN